MVNALLARDTAYGGIAASPGRGSCTPGRDTSGLIMVAKTDVAQAGSWRSSRPAASRRLLALVQGGVEASAGRIEAPSGVTHGSERGWRSCPTGGRRDRLSRSRALQGGPLLEVGLITAAPTRSGCTSHVATRGGRPSTARTSRRGPTAWSGLLGTPGGRSFAVARDGRSGALEALAAPPTWSRGAAAIATGAPGTAAPTPGTPMTDDPLGSPPYRRPLSGARRRGPGALWWSSGPSGSEDTTYQARGPAAPGLHTS